MVIAVDFDGTIIEEDKPYADTFTLPTLKPGVLDALRKLKAAGHVLVLWSGRNNRSRQTLPELDPLVRAGLRPNVLSDVGAAIEANRWRQMMQFANTALVGIFDAIDDGRCGKIAADVYIDNKSLRIGPDLSWGDIGDMLGA